jgi:hypothetical protein
MLVEFREAAQRKIEAENTDKVKKAAKLAYLNEILDR